MKWNIFWTVSDVSEYVGQKVAGPVQDTLVGQICERRAWLPRRRLGILGTHKELRITHSYPMFIQCFRSFFCVKFLFPNVSNFKRQKNHWNPGFGQVAAMAAMASASVRSMPSTTSKVTRRQETWQRSQNRLLKAANSKKTYIDIQWYI